MSLARMRVGQGILNLAIAEAPDVIEKYSNRRKRREQSRFAFVPFVSFCSKTASSFGDSVV
jgi:hypothetical protein